MLPRPYSVQDGSHSQSVRSAVFERCCLGDPRSLSLSRLPQLPCHSAATSMATLALGHTLNPNLSSNSTHPYPRQASACPPSCLTPQSPPRASRALLSARYVRNAGRESQVTSQHLEHVKWGPVLSWIASPTTPSCSCYQGPDTQAPSSGPPPWLPSLRRATWLHVPFL